jgi:hypothetical protein
MFGIFPCLGGGTAEYPMALKLGCVMRTRIDPLTAGKNPVLDMKPIVHGSERQANRERRSAEQTTIPV